MNVLKEFVVILFCYLVYVFYVCFSLLIIADIMEYYFSFLDAFRLANISVGLWILFTDHKNIQKLIDYFLSC